MHPDRSIPDNKALGRVLNDYYNDRMRYLPLEATQNGDTRFNDLLPADFTDSYMDTLRDFYGSYLRKILVFDRDQLNRNDRISYDIFLREMKINLEGLDLHLTINIVLMPNIQYMPFNQFEGVPISMGQMGSGLGIQPFKTVSDYDNWIKRAGKFQAWTDSAIVYFRKGLQNGYILPRCLVEKMIPEMQDMVVKEDITKSIFYTPVLLMPADFSADEKTGIRTRLTGVITEVLSPSYKKLADFLQNEYLPKSRSSIGFDALPNGNKIYDFLIRYWTTTNKNAEEIYQTGLSEVKRIRGEMEETKVKAGFTGDLPAFFSFMKNDPRFTPYQTPEDVLNAFKKIQLTIDPNLHKLFGRTPKMKFEIRQTEAFRAASASAEYIQGDPEGTRPGVFYVPILDAKKFNTTSGMESLFLHEAIPGHHYQNSLQLEDTLLPKFRRFGWYGAYGEGWALYSESLGKELGLYTDPYQYIGALGDEVHRAIRLVVDVAMHQKKMTREEAIQYMMANEAISEQGATSEIERYIGNPAQALSYKTGALVIRDMRTRFTNELGNKFSVSAFHDEVLDGGCMPLDVFERKMEAWEMDQ
jgi:uncharacterized protein (DUF885 family)